MRTQSVFIEDRRAWGDTGPLTDLLKVSSPISAIDIIIRATNGATSNQGNPLHIDVDRIEIIDGSDRLFSLSMVQGIIQHAMSERNYPPHLLSEAAAAVQEQGFRISFGRYLGDPEYWLDPGQFRNLAYRLTGDLTISATVGFATGTRDVTLIAHTMIDAPGGRAGYFMTKEMFQFTTVASGDQRIALPDDFMYRSIGLRAFETAIAFHVDVTNVKLTRGKDAFVYYDVRAEALRDLVQNTIGEHAVAQTLFRTDADTPDLYLAYVRAANANAVQDFDIASFDAITINQGTVQLITLAAAPTIAKSWTNRSILAEARGLMPHHGLVIPFGDLNDPTNWPGGDDIQDLELVLTQGGSGAAATVWAQQVRP